MSQHDMVIDNGPGQAVRIDMQAAIQALVMNSSGPLEPVTKFAGMYWLDTSILPNGALKQRNLANTAWVNPAIGVAASLAGEISFFARATPPAGWLKANGVAVSRTTYAALFTAIGTQFGIGDGSTTFNLPDLRGEFVRCWDDGRGVDAARAFGNLQTDTVENHAHTAATTVAAGGSHAHGLTGATAASAGAHVHTASTDTEPAHGHPTLMSVASESSTESDTTGGLLMRNSNLQTLPAHTSATPGINPGDQIGAAGAHAHAVTVNSGGAHTHTVTGNTDTEPAHAHTATTTVAAGGGGAETRPRNVSLLACIRYE